MRAKQAICARRLLQEGNEHIEGMKDGMERNRERYLGTIEERKYERDF